MRLSMVLIFFLSVVYFGCERVLVGDDDKYCYIAGRSLVGPQWVNYKNNYWDEGEEIRVGFIGGSQDEVEYTKKWFGVVDSLISVDFIYVNDYSEGDIRVSFERGRGSWSYLGKALKNIDKSRATMNLGWREGDGRVVIHELLHSLNFLHEHQNPVNPINWDRDKVIEKFSGPPNYWSVGMIENNILNVQRIDFVDASERDDKSIMKYFFPCDLVKDNKGCGDRNRVLSGMDKNRLVEVYGEEEVVVIDEEEECEDIIEEIFFNIAGGENVYWLNRDQLVYICNELGIQIVGNERRWDLVVLVREELK